MAGNPEMYDPLGIQFFFFNLRNTAKHKIHEVGKRSLSCATPTGQEEGLAADRCIVSL